VAFACLLHDASECYLSDVPRPFKKTLSGYKEQEKNLLDLIYQKYLGSPLNAKEEQLLKEIDDAMLWFDLTYLLNEPQEREAPEIHITIDYTVRAFEETEKEYLELYSFFTH
jgi:5'-deoxynucleotidase YfbR-like HD superfamily hydrolase